MARIKKISVNTRAVQKRFTAMSRRSTDFGAVFRWTFQALQRSHMLNFATQGTTSGSPWKPLDPQYASWKLENYGAHGILVREGDLRSSLTMNSSRGAVREIGKTSATFGTEMPYAKFHQTGTRKMAKREPLFVPKLMATRTANVVAEYIVHGTVGVVYTGAANGFVI